MPTPDDWSREVDDALFGDAASESPPRAHWPGSLEFPQSPEAQSPPRRDVPIEALDNELFGRTETNVPSEPDAQDPLVPPDVTAPAIMPIILDEDEPEVIADEWPGGRGARRTRGDKRGRRRALAATVLLALVVAVGVTIGAIALTRSSGSRPAVDTGSDVTTTPTSTSTPAAATVPAPETSPPQDSQPLPTTRPAPRTTPGTRAPGAAPTEPPPPDPEPPPPQPPPPPPPPPTTSPPPTTLLPPAP